MSADCTCMALGRIAPECRSLCKELRALGRKGSALMALAPCPDCPDGYVWTARGPTNKACPTCLGTARVLVRTQDNVEGK